MLPNIFELPISDDDRSDLYKIDLVMNKILNLNSSLSNSQYNLSKLQNTKLSNNFHVCNQMECKCKKNSENINLKSNNLQYNQMQKNEFQNVRMRNMQFKKNYFQKNQFFINDLSEDDRFNPSIDINQIILKKEREPLKKSYQTIKGIWNHEEDEKLIQAVKETYPLVWEIIASKVPGRSPIQCKERWLYRLHPDINKAKFEKWEDDIIINERAKMGNSWTYISTKLKGRTSCAVKNRWYSVLRYIKA